MVAAVGCALVALREDGRDDDEYKPPPPLVWSNTLIESRGCPTMIPAVPAAYPAIRPLLIDLAE